MDQPIICSYSRTITRWLTKRFPGSVSLDSSGACNDEIISVFQLLLPAVEFQSSTQGQYHLSGRIRQVSGLATKKEQLHWLIELFDQSKLPEAVKDELYDQLKVFVKWEPGPAQIELSRIPVSIKKPEPAQKAIRLVKPNRIVRQKIQAALELSANQRSLLLDAMKFSLAMKYRETDPVSFAGEGEPELFDMGRGLHIALVGMQMQRRLSLENYIGYMAFRNGIPIAYGGGWIWGRRCRIGISIYPEFRKAESSWVFSQVLRLYYQYFNARHFIIRANQFGKGNHDGLKSGAFWFYYKLGFRPCESALRKRARDEWKKICADRHYRSSLETLRTFLSSPLEWKPGNEPPQPDAEDLSWRISEMINNVYGGSRARAIRSIKYRLGETDKSSPWLKNLRETNSGVDNWILLISLFDRFDKWKKTDRKKLAELIRMKLSGKERDHILGMQRLPVFWASLDNLTAI